MGLVYLDAAPNDGNTCACTCHVTNDCEKGEEGQMRDCLKVWITAQRPLSHFLLSKVDAAPWHGSSHGRTCYARSLQGMKSGTRWYLQTCGAQWPRRSRR